MKLSLTALALSGLAAGQYLVSAQKSPLSLQLNDTAGKWVANSRLQLILDRSLTIA
jgi:hypothetical protein